MKSIWGHSWSHVVGRSNAPSLVVHQVLVVDISSSISALSFTDLDLDPLELGGWITWTPPGKLGLKGSKMAEAYLG